MNTDFMERMAREYNQQLRAGDATLLSQCIYIVEKQLDYIVMALACTKQCNQAMQYLESLKRQTLRDLMALSNKIEIASTRPKTRAVNDVFNKLVDLQIELFTNLDYLKENGVAVDAIILNETRALGIMAVIR